MYLPQRCQGKSSFQANKVLTSGRVWEEVESCRSPGKFSALSLKAQQRAWRGGNSGEFDRVTQHPVSKMDSVAPLTNGRGLQKSLPCSSHAESAEGSKSQRDARRSCRERVKKGWSRVGAWRAEGKLWATTKGRWLESLGRMRDVRC